MVWRRFSGWPLARVRIEQLGSTQHTRSPLSQYGSGSVASDDGGRATAAVVARWEGAVLLLDGRRADARSGFSGHGAVQRRQACTALRHRPLLRLGTCGAGRADLRCVSGRTAIAPDQVRTESDESCGQFTRRRCARSELGGRTRAPDAEKVVASHLAVSLFKGALDACDN